MQSVNRRSFIRDLTFLGGTLPLFRSWAHQSAPARSPRIGFLMGDGYPELAAAFREELSRLGYTEGRNIVIEARFSRPNTSELEAMAAELARMDLALIVAGALPYALEVRKANPSMPMVIGTCPGMVSNGFAQTLDRPAQLCACSGRGLPSFRGMVAGIASMASRKHRAAATRRPRR